MGMKKMDIFEKWRESGQLPQILDFIRDCSRKLVSQREISQYLNINEATFSRLKKAHPEIEEVQMKAKFDLKKDLVGAIVGFVAIFVLIVSLKIALPILQDWVQSQI